MFHWWHVTVVSPRCHVDVYSDRLSLDFTKFKYFCLLWLHEERGEGKQNFPQQKFAEGYHVLDLVLNVFDERQVNVDVTLRKLVVQWNTRIRDFNEAALQKRNVNIKKLPSWKILKDSESLLITPSPYPISLPKREEGGVGRNTRLLMSLWRFLILD